MAARRTLTFTTLDQVMPEVDRLLNGCTKAGDWSLGQICNHLAGSIVESVEGSPRRGPWLMRKSLGQFVLRRLLRTGQMPEGIKISESRQPKPDLDDRAEAEALRAALRLFAAHTGPMARHPFFGPVTRGQMERVHCIHCAHHLSFLHPAGSSPGDGASPATPPRDSSREA